MKKNFIKMLVLIILMISFVGVFMKIDKGEVSASAASHDVSGWAWSGLYGWVSFNNANNPPVQNTDYGVNIDKSVNKDYRLSGQAWSSGLGWIYFEKNGKTLPSLAGKECDFISHCKKLDGSTLGLDCVNSDVTACYDIEEDKVYGWANILALGDKGWIRLDQDGSNGAVYEGVHADGTFNGKTILRGWGYNGNSDGTGMGWLSFNSKDCDTNEDHVVDADKSPACGSGHIDPYAILADINVPPTIDNVAHPASIVHGVNCDLGSVLNGYKLHFTYLDDARSTAGIKYRIKLIGTNATYDSGATPCAISETANGNCGAFLHTSCFDGTGGEACEFIVPDGSIHYGENSYFTLQVWDAQGADSGVVDLSTAAVNTVGVTEYPDVDFTFDKTNYSVGEQIKISANAFYYNAGNSTPVPCTDGLGHCTYTWTIPSGYTPNSELPNHSEKIITVDDMATGQIKLKVTAGGNFCEPGKQPGLTQALPSWEEGD